MPGRPPFEWTDSVKAEILTRMSTGESIMDICGTNRDDFLPSRSAFYAYLLVDPEFLDGYMRAREVQAHNEAEEIRSIADMATPEDVGVARLRIDARKWRASKMAPQHYGDKLDLNHGGAVVVNLPDGSKKV